jgi:phosphate transport system substrate-binding protein
MRVRSKAISSRGSSLFFLAGLALLGWYGVASSSSPAGAAETLTLSSSAQVYEAFRGEYLEVFQKKTGVVVDVEVVSSSSAVLRLSNGASDVAATAEGLHRRFKAQGMREFPFCRDALVVITNVRNPVQNLSEDQLRGVFSGAITNWGQVSGPNLQIRVISPDKETAAYKMFSGMVMRGIDIDYYVLTARSTVAAEVTRKFTGAVSFVNQGALQRRAGAAHAVQIDGRGPGDPGYPYYEIFSLVTRGRSEGPVKEFVDFAFSEEARRIISARGMKPIAK